MDFLVVYYSHSENNQKIARLIRRRLSCDILRIEELGKRTAFKTFLDTLFNRYPPIKTDVCAPGDYRHIIFVAPVWSSKIAAPMKTFLRKEKKNVNEYSFVAVGSGDPGSRDKIERQLESLLGKSPDDILELSDDDALLESKINRFLMTKNLLLSYIPR